MVKRLMIDPPGGWRYGFPREIPKDQHIRAAEWLVENGYPEWLLESFEDKFHYRMWETDE